MKELIKANNWLSGIQWLFFIFTNIVVIPITVGEAFELPQESIVSLLQLSFIVTGIACMLQALIGHGRAVMEGQSGLWWGVILTLVMTASAQGMTLGELGGSISVGIIISGVITVIIGLSGLGTYLARLFNPAVMGVFMFLLGAQLVGIFMKGMLGIPFGNEEDTGSIQLPVALLSIFIVAMIIFINIKARISMRRYSLLIGIIAGWLLYILLFDSETSAGLADSQFSITLFPFGNPTIHIGIILTIILTGLLNIANTFGALKGTDNIYKSETTSKQYRASFTITGAVSGISGFLGLVPYSPYVSSIGFLKQTGDIRRTTFVLGGFLFLLMGLIPPVGGFFSNLPLSVGSAVLFVSYVLLFHSSLDFFKQVKFNTMNIYRSAVPLFVGIIIMTMPASYFTTIPSIVRPLVSNGLLVGIMLAILLEGFVDWDRFGE
ncbi:uracil/xanthine transporter [Oceanobacillus chungangensis]|uniref:Uracil/xanthine transporter n=1 Tax=Oceanobacillus chungangensis TaxID=1229152 RepID=A0A3D8PJR4_9BACI|nr:uracil/xanthine transporter [Oceanobacillus chungangensis]RDW15471.1 uracil/xanthine transporter [Oceanobacillus chungangensis]